MLKLTKTGIGLLTRQYRSVLHKCFLINVGLFALGAATMMVPNEAEAITSDGVLTLLNTGRETWSQSGSSAQSVTFNTSAKTATGTIAVNLNNAVSYYTYSYTVPSNYESETRKQNLSSSVMDKYFYNQTSTTDSNSYYGGAIYIAGGTTIDTIKADFIKNYKNTNNYSQSGAIESEANSTINNIDGVFIGNYATDKNESSSSAANIGTHGVGRFANIGTIHGDFIDNHSSKWVSAISIENSADKISGNFIGNYSKSLYVSDAMIDGSALVVANNLDNIVVGQIEGNFIGNYIDQKNGGKGAAINNGSTITTIGSANKIAYFVANYIKAASGQGGAISTGKHGSKSVGYIGTMYADFENNYIQATTGTARGGALYNDVSVDNVYADFVENYVKTTSGTPQGGAIYNEGTITSIEGDFKGNYATSTSSVAEGGAIYNSGTIGLVRGNFVNNKSQGGAASSGSYSRGGAIQNGISDTANSAKMTVIGNFIGNSVVSTAAAEAEGGAIENNSGAEITVTGDFIGNSMEGRSSSSMANIGGGAIANSGGKKNTTTTVYDASFINNYASNSLSSGPVAGGAIMNYSANSYQGIVNLIAQNKDVYFYNNKAGTAYDDYFTYLYSGSSYGEGYLNLNAAIDKSIIFNGRISITNKGTMSPSTYAYINLNQGSSNIGGEYVFNNTVSGHELHLYNGANVKFGAVIQGKELGYTNDEIAAMTDAQRQQAIDNLYDQASDIDTIHAIQNGTASLGTGESLSYGSFDVTLLQNDANGGVVDMINNHIDNNTAAQIALNSDLEIEIDIAQPASGTTGTADQITYSAYSGSGKRLVIDAINNISGMPTSGTYYYPVLSGSGVTLDLSDELSSGWVKEGTPHTVIDAVKETTLWADSYYDKTVADVQTNSVSVDGNNLVVTYTEPVETVISSTSLGDTLALVNQASGTRNFNTSSATATYISSDTPGETVGTLNINGVIDGDDRSSLDLNNKTGFVLDSSDTINLSNMALSGASSYTADLDGVSTKMALNNTNLSGAEVKGSGSVELTGTNTVSAPLNNSGATEVKSGSTTFEDEVKNLQVDAGAEASIDSDDITDTATNNGTLKLRGGVLNTNLAGAGNLRLMGTTGLRSTATTGKLYFGDDDTNYVSSIATSISDASTDNEIATAKAVYDYLNTDYYTKLEKRHNFREKEQNTSFRGSETTEESPLLLSGLGENDKALLSHHTAQRLTIFLVNTRNDGMFFEADAPRRMRFSRRYAPQNDKSSSMVAANDNNLTTFKQAI